MFAPGGSCARVDGRQWGAPGLAKAVVWAVRLGIVGVLFYVAFWLALLLIFMVAVMWIGQHDSADADGNGGFSLFADDDPRNAPGYDPVLHNDIEHPDYHDEKDA